MEERRTDVSLFHIIWSPLINLVMSQMFWHFRSLGTPHLLRVDCGLWVPLLSTIISWSQSYHSTFLRRWQWPQHRPHLAVLSVTFKLASRDTEKTRDRRAVRSGPSFEKVLKFCREQIECYTVRRLWSLFSVFACLTWCRVRGAVITTVSLISVPYI